jgi:hypothetical protein
MFGAGIYFAGSPGITNLKARNLGVILRANVHLERALVLHEPDPSMDRRKLKNYGCQSVKGQSGPRHLWEYVVYESSRVTNIKREDGTLEPV